MRISSLCDLTKNREHSKKRRQTRRKGETMETKDLTCEERIDARLGRELREVRQALTGGRNDDGDRAFESYRDAILCVDDIEGESLGRSICLSWGGPASYWHVWLLPKHPKMPRPAGFTRIVYVFQDWFDGAERELAGDDFRDVAALLAKLSTRQAWRTFPGTCKIDILGTWGR